VSINTDTLLHLRSVLLTFDHAADAHTRALTAAWVDAWDDLAPALDAAVLDLVSAAKDGRVTRSMVVRSARLRDALLLVADRLDKLAGQAGNQATGSLRTLVEQATTAQVAMIESQLPDGMSGLVRVDPRQVDQIIARATGRIHSLSRPLSDDQVRVMKRRLVRGVLVGDNPRTTARRIVADLEGDFNGGLTRALTIARTESLDAMRAASQAADKASGVVTGWEWVADLGPRCCPACWGMHGTVHKPDERGPDGHQNCRCSRVPVTPSWADLGFKGIEEPPSLLPDKEQAFRSLSADQQRSILGPGRYDAWKTGGFPMDQWARLRHNPGWRDSWVPAPVPAAARSTAAAS